MGGRYVLTRDTDQEIDAEPVETVDSTPPSSVPLTADQLMAILPASPIDGKESQRLPVLVTPKSELADGQTIAVVGKGFVPDESVGAVMCAAEASIEGVAACDLGSNGTYDHVTYTNASSEGFVRVDVVVRRFIDTPVTGPLDCMSAAERCIVALGAVADYDRSGGAPLGFAGQPPFPAPAVTLSAAGPYMPDQLVDVQASGLLWPREVGAELCQLDRCAVLVRGRVRPDGTFVATVPLVAAFVHTDGSTVTCDVACELRVRYLGLPEGTQAPVPPPVPISFASMTTAPPPSGPPQSVVASTLAPTSVLPTIEEPTTTG